MKIPALTFTILLFISCSTKPVNVAEPDVNTNTAQTAANTPSVNKLSVNEKPLERVQNSPDKVKLPEIKDFGTADLRRISENKSSGGLLLPPFEYAEIDTTNFKEVKPGEKYTVVPLDVNISPFHLPVTKTVKTENNGCNEKEPAFFWAIEFERIVNKEILEIEPVKNSSPEFPFDVFLIYPAVEFAKQIPQNELNVEMLPKGIALKTVKGAIDLDNDGKPDLLEASYCCTETNVSPEEDVDCYTCLKTFRKEKGVWKLIDEAIPC